MIHTGRVPPEAEMAGQMSDMPDLDTSRTNRPHAAQILLATAATLAMLYFLQAIIVPMVVAFVMTILVSALLRWIVAWWPRAPSWSVVAIAGTIIAAALAGGMFVLSRGAIELIHRGPKLYARIDQLVAHAGHMSGLEKPLHLDALVGNVSIAKIASGLLSGAEGVVTGLVLTLLYFVFMLASRDEIPRKLRRMIASRADSRAAEASLAQVAAEIETYVWVQTITGLMLSVGSALVMLGIGLDNALFWVIALFLLSFIPTIGVTIGSIAPALFALLQFPTAWHSLAIFGGIQVVAFVVGNLIYPKLQADTQNIAPVSTILALSFWSFMWGLPGALLAVPLTLMLMVMFVQSPKTRWIAVLLSNDGNPTGPHLGTTILHPRP